MNSLPTEIHGGRVFEAAAALKRPWYEIIDFSANINPLGQPRGLKRALFEDFERSLHYPELRAESLTRRLAEIKDLSPAHFLMGAGSTPHLHLLAHALAPERAVIIGPAFAEYEAALERFGLRPTYVLTREKDDWLPTRETLDELFKKNPNAVFLANPANPTGRLTPGEIMIELVDECRRRDILLIVDEAFIDFTEKGRSLLPLTARNQKLVVLRSLTKIFALPGLRLAYLAAHPSLVSRLAQLAEPWSLSCQAISAGHFCLAKDNIKTNTLKGLRIFRKHMLGDLNALNLGKIYPSEANFILLRLKDRLKPQALLDHLFRDGILVRDASNFNGLKPGYLRLAIRPLEEINSLTVSLKGFLAEAGHLPSK